jgi:tryptophan 2,3-dioxygenase
MLLTHAADDIAYGAVFSATHRLHATAVLMDRLLPKTFRILEPLTLDDWLRFRPLIEKPSAIQAVNYRTVAAKLQRVHVNFAPHRFRPWELELAETYQRILAVVCRAHVRWQAQHIAIVAKYTPEASSNGLDWLRTRVETLRHQCKPHRVRVVRKHHRKPAHAAAKADLA